MSSHPFWEKSIGTEHESRDFWVCHRGRVTLETGYRHHPQSGAWMFPRLSVFYTVYLIETGGYLFGTEAEALAAGISQLFAQQVVITDQLAELIDRQRKLEAKGKEDDGRTRW